MDIDAIIKAAKLGRERKGAQVDTCVVFAAALYDVLSAKGIKCGMVTVIPDGFSKWAHAVVEVAGRYYDSMGEFSADIYRALPGFTQRWRSSSTIGPTPAASAMKRSSTIYMPSSSRGSTRLSLLGREDQRWN